MRDGWQRGGSVGGGAAAPGAPAGGPIRQACAGGSGRQAHAGGETRTPGAPRTTANGQASVPGAPRTTANGHARADRAAQFMPFAALRGYYELLRQEARVTEPQHELTDEEARELSAVVQRVRKRQMVRVRYYDRDAYTELTGCVAHIDLAARELWVVKTRIPLDSISRLEILDEQ